MGKYIIFVAFIIIAGFISKIANIIITSIPNEKYFLLRIDYKELASHENMKIVDILPFTCLYRSIESPKKLAPRYFIVEILYTGFVCFTFIKFGISINFLKYSLMGLALVITAFTDIEGMYIFVEVNIGAGILAVFFNLIGKYVSWQDMLVAVAIGFIPMYLFGKLGMMGEGDAYLMGMVGVFLGWKMTLVCLFIAVVIGGIVGIILMIFKHYGRKSEMPFGPPICVAAVITIFFGNQLLNWYLNYAFAR